MTAKFPDAGSDGFLPVGLLYTLADQLPIVVLIVDPAVEHVEGVEIPFLHKQVLQGPFAERKAADEGDAVLLMEAVKPGIVIIDEAELSPAAVPEGLLAEGIVGLEPDQGGIIFIAVDQPPVGHDTVSGISLLE